MIRRGRERNHVGRHSAGLSTGDERPPAPDFREPAPTSARATSARAGAPRKIRVDRVSRNFTSGNGSEVRALEDITLDVRTGEFLCIVGPSGCGKSTLLHLVAGLLNPSAGELWVDHRRISGPGSDRIILFQDLGLFPWLNARENVEFGLRLRGLKRAERQERARHYLQLVHLAQFEDSYMHQLSGGM